MSSPDLKVRQLAVARGDRTIVEALDFAVAAGEILHIQGRNGAGKTSLLEVLCGLRPAAAGVIEGQPQPEQRHWLGHKNGLNPALSPEENLRFWCALNGQAAADPAQALQRVGLKAQRHRPCGKLSTGQRRRAALARLLAAPRPWWFLDEPLAGLDHSGIDLLAELLDRHRRGGGAALVSSHQPLPPGLGGVRSLELRL
jgi:heme exporter protein A